MHSPPPLTEKLSKYILNEKKTPFPVKTHDENQQSRTASIKHCSPCSFFSKQNPFRFDPATESSWFFILCSPLSTENGNISLWHDASVRLLKRRARRNEKKKKKLGKGAAAVTKESQLQSFRGGFFLVMRLEKRLGNGNAKQWGYSPHSFQRLFNFIPDIRDASRRIPRLYENVGTSVLYLRTTSSWSVLHPSLSSLCKHRELFHFTSHRVNAHFLRISFNFISSLCIWCGLYWRKKKSSSSSVVCQG